MRYASRVMVILVAIQASPVAAQTNYEWLQRQEEERYAYEAAAARAAALKKLCETGFGPPSLCSPIQPPPAPPAPVSETTAPQKQDRMSVVEVTAWGGTAVATIVFADGTTRKVKVGDDVSGNRVTAISATGGVRMATPRGDIVLGQRQTVPPPISVPVIQR